MSPLTSLHNRRFMRQARQTRSPVIQAVSYTCTKRVFPFSFALRIRRICSSNETYKLRCNVLTQYLNRRGYKVGFLNQKIQRVHTITWTDALKLSDAITDSHTLVAGYNPALPSISSIFHRHIRIPSKIVLLCLNLCLSFASEVLTSRKSAIRGLPIISRLML